MYMYCTRWRIPYSIAAPKNGCLGNAGPARPCDHAASRSQACQKPVPQSKFTQLLWHRLRYNGAMKIGYARVSTHEQLHDLQIDSLKAAGCERIYTDTCSGSVPGAERPELQNALASARTGDTLVVWRLDRLGRSLQDLIRQINGLAEREVQFVSLQEDLNTAAPGRQADLPLLRHPGQIRARPDPGTYAGWPGHGSGPRAQGWAQAQGERPHAGPRRGTDAGSHHRHQ